MSITKIFNSFFVAIGCVALVGCSNITSMQSAVPEASQKPTLVLPPIVSSAAVKPPREVIGEEPISLVGILWKMATTEKEALPKQILPYFGVNEIPPVKMYREDYGWFSIPYQPPRIIDMPLENIGVATLSYSYTTKQSPFREQDYYSIRPIEGSICISAQEVIRVFGRSFKRLPARIKTAAASVAAFQVAVGATATPLEKGSLQFENELFDGRGFVIFQFDSQPCAEFIFFNYTRKYQ